MRRDIRTLQEEQQRKAGEEVSSSVDWDNFPQQATAALTHHGAILRNKRLLLTYQCVRFIPGFCFVVGDQSISDNGKHYQGCSRAGRSVWTT